MNENNFVDPDILLMPLPVNGKKRHGRSDLAQEIISRKPDFIEKWALLVFLAMLLLLLATTWFINYPDIVQTSATLMARNGPKEMIARQEGRLVKLFVSNDQEVNPNQVLGWIESSANQEEVLVLSSQLDSSTKLLASGEFNKLSGVFRVRYEHLGELQSGYQQFIAAWQLFDDYMVNGFYNRKRNMLEKDLASLHDMHNSVNQQKDLTSQDIRLAEESLKMNEILLKEKVISIEEFRNEKSKLLGKQSSLPQLNASMISNETQQREKFKELSQLDHDVAQERLVFEQALRTLRSNVDDWIRRFILRSPIKGRIVFMVPLQENKFLQQGKLLGYVVPDNAGYYAEITLPQSNFGKIDSGLQVQLRFEAYPYEEFGFVQGRLSYISRVPSDSGFPATVILDKGLVSNYAKTIPYTNGLKAQAIVVTNTSRLFQRIYYSIVKSASVKK